MFDFDGFFKGWAGDIAVRSFLERVYTEVVFAGGERRVLELGSRASRDDHDARSLIRVDGGTWTGVDWREGPGVDLVGVVDLLAKDGKLPTDNDLVLSISTLEHDPRWPATIRAAVASVRNGGAIALCCAGPGSPATELECSPPGADASTPAGTHYAGISLAALVANVCAVANRDGRDVLSVEGWYARDARLSAIIARIGHV